MIEAGHEMRGGARAGKVLGVACPVPLPGIKPVVLPGVGVMSSTDLKSGGRANPRSRNRALLIPL